MFSVFTFFPDKIDNVDGIKMLYEERISEGFQPTEKFMSLLHQIIEVRNLQDFTVQPTNTNLE